MARYRVWSSSKERRHPRLVEANSPEEAMAQVTRSTRASLVLSTREWDALPKPELKKKRRR